MCDGCNFTSSTSTWYNMKVFLGLEPIQGSYYYSYPPPYNDTALNYLISSGNSRWKFDVDVICFVNSVNFIYYMFCMYIGKHVEWRLFMYNNCYSQFDFTLFFITFSNKLVLKLFFGSTNCRLYRAILVDKRNLGWRTVDVYSSIYFFSSRMCSFYRRRQPFIHSFSW